MERTLRIESLVHGGDGLARDDGRVVLVPLTVPGDLARVDVLPSEGRTGRGRLVDVLERGPERQDPPCPLVGTCGGCQWQQVSIEEQRVAKFAHVRDALVRIGRFTDPPMRDLVPSPRTWRYRRRLRGHLTRSGWGFSARASHDIAGIAACLLVEPEVERLAHAVAEALHAAGAVPNAEAFTIDVVGAETGRPRGAFSVAARKPQALRKILDRLIPKGIAGVTGAVLEVESGTPEVFGQPVLVDQEHRGLRVRPDLFAQANRLGARLLGEATAALIDPGASVLEVFAGTGTLSLSLLERAGRLVATEGNAAALDLLRASLRDSGRTAQLVAGPAGRVLEGYARGGERFDQVVLDPPRTGAREIMADVARLARRSVVYVSCDPATFARDAGLLAAAGWRLASATPFDLFPHTHHVEVLAEFVR